MPTVDAVALELDDLAAGAGELDQVATGGGPLPKSEPGSPTVPASTATSKFSSDRLIDFLRATRLPKRPPQRPDLTSHLKTLDRHDLLAHCTQVLEGHGARPLWEPPLRATWHRRETAA